METENAPVEVGVPLISPVTVFMFRPLGSPEAPKLLGEFVAAIVYENAEFCVAAALEALVTTGGCVVVTTEAVWTIAPASQAPEAGLPFPSKSVVK